MAMDRVLDKYDIQILEILSTDGRISWTELSERIALSQTPTLRRVRALESEGLITGYRAVIDEVRLGMGLSVFVSVSLERQTDEALANFENSISQLPSVMDCYMMTGDADYLLRVILPDVDAFRRFVSVVTTLDGVARVTSSFAVKSVVQRATPLLSNQAE
jgi:Lrp/AsnC family transcriptional regulator, leucine-responsive regulatory protein